MSSPGDSSSTDTPSSASDSTLLTGSDIGVARLTQTGEIATANDAFVQLTSHPHENLIGKPFTHLLTTPPSLLETRLNGEYTDTNPIELTLPLETGDGDVLTCKSLIKPLPDNDETDHEFVAILYHCSEETPTSSQETKLNQGSQIAPAKAFIALADALPDGIIVLDTDSQIQYANPAVERILGHSPEELVGGSKLDIIPERLREAHLNALDRYLETGTKNIDWEYTELPGQHKDGHEVPLGISLSDFFFNGNRYFVGLFRDISPRKQAEQARREREQSLKEYKEYTNEILDTIDDMFYVFDSDETLQRWNQTFREVTGYTDAELESMHILDFFDEDNQDAIKNVNKERRETGHTRLEADLLTKHGETIPYEFIASELEDPDGQCIIAGIGREITERKSRERDLKQRTQQQQVVADLGQFALETDDLDKLMHEAARQCAEVLDNDYCKVLDLDEKNEELLLRQGVGWKEGIVGEATVSSIEADSQAAYTLANDHPIIVEDLETETRFSGPDLLTSHDVRSGISVIIGPFDEPWGILGTHDTDVRTFTEEDVNFVQSIANILADAIERQEYQAKLEQLVADLEESNERLEQFAYAASHDLQEPLRMVSSYLQLLEKRYEKVLDEDGEEFLEFALDGAERMSEMIDGLLEYSRVETQGEPLEPVDLTEVLEDIMNDLQLKIDESDATIRAEDLPTVLGDEGQLRQVFQNLVGNAIDYSGDEPPEIDISAEWTGKMWKIAVQDNGIGIDPAETDRVFEVFQRLHTQDEYSGTGLGLALCQRIVERHGGQIGVESKPDEGSTFFFTLPDTTTQI